MADPFFQKAVSPSTQNNKHVWRKSKIQRQWDKYDKYYIDKSKENEGTYGKHPTMSTKLQWLRECLAGGDVLCHATFWPWIPTLQLHGCPFQGTVKQPCVYSQLVLRFLISIFLWLFCLPATQSYNLTWIIMNHILLSVIH